MMHPDELAVFIADLESSLHRKNVAIDINAPDWLEKARQASQPDAEQRLQVRQLRRHILDMLHTSDKAAIEALRSRLHSTTRIIQHVPIPISEIARAGNHSAEMFRDAFELLAFVGPGADPRDTLLEIKEMIRFAVKKKLDYKGAIDNALKFAGNDTAGSFGSMSTMLEKCLQCDPF